MLLTDDLISLIATAAISAQLAGLRAYIADLT